jgi:hypothetical protein
MVIAWLTGAFDTSIIVIMDQAAKHLNIGESTGGTDVTQLDGWIDKAMAQVARDGIEARWLLSAMWADRRPNAH